MTTFIIVGVIFFVLAVFIFQGAHDHNERIIESNKAFQQLYTYDEDFSLRIKGYPMVTDHDIRYTESLVDEARKSATN